uniref:troponin T, fast skeletal muscle isoform X3 n=1 Tax=Callithrix jacchus TaxID=9483 RepID=UPI0023DD2E9F|nr:troponin T, fast skeletal muscle isoform X3 [Callithrix jacchus]
MCPVLGVKIEADSSEKRREDLASFSKHVLGILASFGLLWPFLYLSRSRAPVPAAGPVHRELQPFSQETHRKHPPSPCLTRKLNRWRRKPKRKKSMRKFMSQRRFRKRKSRDPNSLLLRSQKGRRWTSMTSRRNARTKTSWSSRPSSTAISKPGRRRKRS